MALRSRAARPHHAVGSGMCRVLWFPPGRGIYCPNTSSIRPRGTLNLSDLALDNHTAPSMARLCIKQSKTDPFRQGVEVFLGKTGSEVCPIQALVHYIGVRSRAHSSSSNQERLSPVPTWCPNYRRHSGELVLRTHGSTATASVSERQQRQPNKC
jgi:hypothetical protein